MPHAAELEPGPKGRRWNTTAILSRVALTMPPLLAIALYLPLLVASLGAVLGQLAWDADSDSPMLIAETLAQQGGGHGLILLGHMGYYPMLSFDLATGWIPAHRVLWTVFPVALWILGLGILTWIGARAAGRQCALVTLALGLAACPTMLLVLSSQGHRGSTLFDTILLLALLVVVQRRGAWAPATVVAGATVALITAVCLASDTFVVAWGLIPFVVAPVAVLALWPGRRQIEAVAFALVVAGIAGGLSWLFARVMHHFGFRLLPVDTTINHPDQVVRQAQLLTADIPNVFGGAVDGPRILSQGLPGVMAVLGATALVLVVLLALSQPWRRRPATGAESLRALCITFWATSVVLVAGAFLVTNFAVDKYSTRYLLTFFVAVVAVIPIWACGSHLRVALVAFTPLLASIAAGLSLRTAVDHHFFQPSHTLALSAVVSRLETEGLTQGYSTYWDANAITWTTDSRIRILPVYETPTIKPFISNVVTSWYQEVHAPPERFVLVDPAVPFVPVAPGPEFGAPMGVIRLGRFTILVYPASPGNRVE